jgi:hypothetical protein
MNNRKRQEKRAVAKPTGLMHFVKSTFATLFSTKTPPKVDTFSTA